MKQILLALILTSLCTPVFALGNNQVEGYFHQDGSYVQPYMRTNPDNSIYNNYSYPQNVQPAFKMPCPTPSMPPSQLAQPNGLRIILKIFTATKTLLRKEKQQEMTPPDNETHHHIAWFNGEWQKFQDPIYSHFRLLPGKYELKNTQTGNIISISIATQGALDAAKAGKLVKVHILYADPVPEIEFHYEDSQDSNPFLNGFNLSNAAVSSSKNSRLSFALFSRVVVITQATRPAKCLGLVLSYFSCVIFLLFFLASSNFCHQKQDGVII